MKSSKWILGVMAAVLIMASASSSFAQVQLQIFNTPSPGEIQTNHHANTSDPTSTGSGILVSGSLVANSPLSTTVLTLTFPAPITSNGVNWTGQGANVPPTDPIRIEGGTGVFVNVTAITTVNYSAGTVQITLPCWQGAPSGNAAVCGNVNNSDSGSFRLVGVRSDVAGKTAPLNVTASINSSANNYIPPSTSSLPVITALGTWGNVSQASLSGQPNNNTFLLFTNQVGPAFADATATVLITEAFASAWRTATQSSTSVSPLPNGVQIKLTINGLPSGVTATIVPTTGTTSPRLPAIALSTATVTAPTSSNPTANQLVISFTGTSTSAGPNLQPSLTAIDNILLQLTLSLTGTLGTLAPGAITLVADNDPVGDAQDANGFPTIVGGYPRFATDAKTITIGSIRAANTTLLIPYAVRIATLNFETGIAIANTSQDPFGVNAGGATPAAGTVTVSLFPSTATGAGAASTYTSSASTRVGSGMATDGTIPAGATWAVNLTDILSRATPAITGDFSGYIFVEANFLNAHGVAYVYDGRGFTSNTPALVLPAPLARGVNFEALNN